MEIPAELKQAIRDGDVALANHAKGELTLPYRRRIWRALGPVVVEGKRAVITDGLKRRTKLADLCVRHVLPIWERAFPTDRRPETLLATAQRYLHGEMDWDSVWQAKNTFWSKLDNLMNEGEHFDAVYAGYAAANVVTTALNDERVGPLKSESAELDDDLDPYQWDASFYSSLSYAGGASWEEQSGAARRRELWRWYLSDAVPDAWAEPVKETN